MADAVNSQTLQDGSRWAVMKFTNLSDGTGEAAVQKVDVSALSTYKGLTCTAVTINKIQYDVTGMQVSILWDATTDVRAIVLEGNGCHDFDGTSPLVNNSGSGKNGDILFTTTNHTSGDTYSIVLKMRKYYG